MDSIHIRQEEPGDRNAVTALLREVFGQDDEATLVENLYKDGDILLALVAEREDQIVGHIAFSALPITIKNHSIEAAALAPLAVAQQWQRQGIGSRLVRRAILSAEISALAGVIVLGDPEYYSRFGFSSKTAAILHAPFDGKAFMALEFNTGALSRGGTVKYARAFGLDTIESD